MTHRATKEDPYLLAGVVWITLKLPKYGLWIRQICSLLSPIHLHWRKIFEKSLWTPPIQWTPYLNCYHLVDSTELWAPERPDTRTVSFPKQSISWTLGIKHGADNTIMELFIHHTYFFFSFQICTSDLYTHNCLYCIFAILYIVYLCIVILLSVLSCCCHSVAL